MYNTLMAFITKNYILAKVQNGFREAKSMVTVIRTFLENIQDATVEKTYLIEIFLSLSKAYDVLDHKIYFKN